MSSHSDALGDLQRQRQIFVAGNRLCSFITFPICATLVILGKSVIEAWVGAKYVAQSYPVMLLMVVPSTLMMAQSASIRVLFGMAKHKTLAIVTTSEGLLNIGLSILLVPRYGILGSAIGTAIPLTATMIFFLPAHVCRQLQVHIGTYLREAYSLPLLVCAPLVATLLLLKKWFVPHNYVELLVHLAVAGSVYGTALIWIFASKRAMRMGRLHIDDGSLAEPVGVSVEDYSQEI